MADVKSAIYNTHGCSAHVIAHSDSPHLYESRNGMFIVRCIIAGAGACLSDRVSESGGPYSIGGSAVQLRQHTYSTC